MQNQEISPPSEGSSGSTIGPIEALYIEFLSSQISCADSDLAVVRHIYYSGALSAYNLIVQSMRYDHTLKATVAITEAMRLDLNNNLE